MRFLDIMKWWRGKEESLPKKPLDVLEDYLQSDNLRGTTDTIKRLGMLKDPVAVPRLIELLDHKDEWIAEEAAIALGEIGDARAVLPLVKLLAELEKIDNELQERSEKIKSEPDYARNVVGLAMLSYDLDNMYQRSLRALQKLGTPEAQSFYEEYAMKRPNKHRL